MQPDVRYANGNEGYVAYAVYGQGPQDILFIPNWARNLEAMWEFRGREIQATGDGFLAIFDGPARGVRCGVEIAAAVRSLGLEVRVGLHTGEVELETGAVGGIAVHLAERVMSTGLAGRVMVSGTVKDLVIGSGIEFAERGSRVLKGRTRGVAVVRGRATSAGMG